MLYILCVFFASNNQTNKQTKERKTKTKTNPTKKEETKDKHKKTEVVGDILVDKFA